MLTLVHRREQTEAEAIAERAGYIATDIARRPVKRDERGSSIDWADIKVDVFGEDVDYFEAADRAQELATFSNERQALAIMRRRYEALVAYLEKAPFVLAMAKDELDRELAEMAEDEYAA